jgi:cytochrome b561
VHAWGAHTLLILAGLHALVALVHQYVLRDRLLERMLPAPGRR